MIKTFDFIVLTLATGHYNRDDVFYSSLCTYVGRRLIVVSSAFGDLQVDSILFANVISSNHCMNQYSTTNASQLISKLRSRALRWNTYLLFVSL